MSKYKSILIETSVDRLVHLVKKEGKVTLARASHILNVEEKQLEEWIRVLEEHGILELRYPALGEPEVILKEMTKGKLASKKGKIEKEHKKVGKKIKEFDEKAYRVEKRIMETDKVFTRAEQDLKRKLERVEKNLKRMKEYEKQRNKVLQEADELKRIAEASAQNFSEVEIAFEYMDRKINDQLRKMTTHEREITNLEQVREKLEREIIFLDKEMRILSAFIKTPIRFPTIRSFTRLLKGHKKRHKKVKNRKEKVHKKITKTKKKIGYKRKFLKSPKKKRRGK